MNNNNYIEAEIDIKENDINKNIRIINSYEEYKRKREWEDKEVDSIWENEKK